MKQEHVTVYVYEPGDVIRINPKTVRLAEKQSRMGKDGKLLILGQTKNRFGDIRYQVITSRLNRTSFPREELLEAEYLGTIVPSVFLDFTEGAEDD